MKKLTSLNPVHPHTQLVHFRQKLRKHYISLSNDQLTAAYAGLMKSVGREPILTNRHERIEEMVILGEQGFKERWKAHYSWDFDDCYDPTKLKAHFDKMVADATAQGAADANKPPELVDALPPAP